jgi:class 3 adenylate cyclase
VVEVELPTGTVTLLFTDIEGSTRMLRSLGDDYGAVLRAHRAILRDAVGRHGGVEFGTMATPASSPSRRRQLGHHQRALLARVLALDPAAAWADQRRTLTT